MGVRTMGLALAFPLMVCAQAPPAGDAARAFVRGVLLERDAQVITGELSVRAPDNHVLRYRFDAKTHVEREQQILDVAHLQPGDKVEVDSDAAPDSPLRYARAIRVIEPEPPPRTLNRIRTALWARADRSAIDPWFFPRGNLTFAGVVFRVTPEHVLLHTRAGDETILLRSDTRYLENGGSVDAASLKPNLRVFVRAGRNIYDQLEGFQVVWGKILEPR